MDHHPVPVSDERSGSVVEPGTQEVDVWAPRPVLVSADISSSYQLPCTNTGVAGRLHISAANRFTSLKVTAWTDRREESYGKYRSDVAREARKEGAETWRLSGTQG